MSVNGEGREIEQQAEAESEKETGPELDERSLEGASREGSRESENGQGGLEGDKPFSHGRDGSGTHPSVDEAQSGASDESGSVEIDLGLDGDRNESLQDTQGMEEEGAGQDDAGSGEDSGEPDWRARVADLELRIDELNRELDKTKNQMLRVAADFENYRKRMQRQLPEAEARASEKVLVEILPVMDSLTLALEHAQGNGDGASLAEGVQLVMKQFSAILAKLGVRPIDALGQPFDPAIHEAMQQEESGDVPPGTVIKEWQRGYQVGERLLRPAMVVVSSAPAGDTQEDASVEESAPESNGVQEDEDKASRDAVTGLSGEDGAKGEGDGGPEEPEPEVSEASEESPV